MSEFRWHLMDKECPPTGYGHYIIMGKRGGMYIADNFESAQYSGYRCFHVPNVRGNYKYDHEIKAWAEIPSLGSNDNSGDLQTLRDLVADMSKAFLTLDIDHCQACPRDKGNRRCRMFVEADGECAFVTEMRRLGIEVER